MRRGLHGVIVIVRGDLTAEPPAHCRLVSDHDLFEIVALLDCTAPAVQKAGSEGRTIARRWTVGRNFLTTGDNEYILRRRVRDALTRWLTPADILPL